MSSVAVRIGRKFSVHNMLQVRNALGIATALCLVLIYIVWTTSAGDFIKSYSPFAFNDSMLICGQKWSEEPPLSTTNANINDRMTQLDKVNADELPIIYFVTPTYPRREQIAELTRLGQTLMHVPKLHWIVADDTNACNAFLNRLLNSFGIPFTHIASPMPAAYRTHKTIPRGVANRRAALQWIKQQHIRTGVLYFGDDDNTFDLKLFSEIRFTKRVSMFPVGLIGQYAVSTPVVKSGKVVGFFDSWPANRKWPVDMAGFATNLGYLAQSPNATMPYRAGYEEDEFLKSIGLKIEDIEPKANNCTEILVWHTQTTKSKPPMVHVNVQALDAERLSLAALFRGLETMGVSHISPSIGVKGLLTKNGVARSIAS